MWNELFTVSLLADSGWLSNFYKIMREHVEKICHWSEVIIDDENFAQNIFSSTKLISKKINKIWIGKIGLILW